MIVSLSLSTFFFFNDTATTEIYTLSLHDALPIYGPFVGLRFRRGPGPVDLGKRESVRRDRSVPESEAPRVHGFQIDRKSTRLNSSHGYISYAVFCLKKKKKKMYIEKTRARRSATH